jgi:twitching motility protein PilT
MNEEHLRMLVLEGVSDIHLKVGRPPLCRIYGILVPSELPELTSEEIVKMAVHLVGEKVWSSFQENPQIETSYEMPGVARFRVSLFRQRKFVSIVLRVIPFEIPTLDSLKVPPVVKKICDYRRGLVLVTGMTGSGKSSTLAGMIRYINERYAYHIITIEDPIEFHHPDLKSSVNQREVGDDTSNFASAFRSALRQDPDVILVGELRDLATMEIALQAAETGHLVLSTVHTTDAKQTIGRMIDVFPPHQQNQIRLQLATNLRAVISQRLLLMANNEGRALAAEVMIVSAAIRDMILDPDKVFDITEHIEKGHDQYGTSSFDQSIMELLENGVVTKEEALRNVTNVNDFELKLSLK